MTKEEYFALFDRGAERKNTGCVKWDALQEVYGREDITPLWVADMDFPSPREVTCALVARAQEGVFGYPADDPALKEAVCDWMRRRHALNIAPEMMLSSAGVVDSLALAVNAFTEPGDLVAIQPPVYGPFGKCVENAGRRVYRNALRQTEAGWQMDLDHLEDGLKRGVKLLLLCSPHNPVGRVWTQEELRQVSALCARYNAKIVADEIHADFEMPGYRHTPLLTINPNAVALVSSTKTFNLAGLRNSSILFGNAQDKEKMERFMRGVGVGEINLFGMLAQTTAYRCGEEWLNALLQYLDGTRALVEKMIAERMPKARVSRLEGTYLMWLDLRAYGLPQEEIRRKLVFEAAAALNDGTAFGGEGEGFARMNIASPRANVLPALERIAAAFEK